MANLNELYQKLLAFIIHSTIILVRIVGVQLYIQETLWGYPSIRIKFDGLNVPLRRKIVLRMKRKKRKGDD